jgi:hypothetical protein
LKEVKEKEKLMDCGGKNEFILPSEFTEESGENQPLFNVWASCIAAPTKICGAFADDAKTAGLQRHVAVDSVGNFQCCGVDSTKVQPPSNMMVDTTPAAAKPAAAKPPVIKDSGSTVARSSVSKSPAMAVDNTAKAAQEALVALSKDNYVAIRKALQKLVDTNRKQSVLDLLRKVQKSEDNLKKDECCNVAGVKKFLVAHSPSVGYLSALTFLNTQRVEKNGLSPVKPNKALQQSILSQLGPSGSEQTTLSKLVGPIICQQFVRVDSNKSTVGQSCSELDEAQRSIVINV